MAGRPRSRPAPVEGVAPAADLEHTVEQEQSSAAAATADEPDAADLEHLVEQEQSAVATAADAAATPVDDDALSADFEARAAQVITALCGELYTVHTAPMEA